MTPDTAAAATRACLEIITHCLDKAAAAAKAAQACIAMGQQERAMTILLDVEQPIYEANALMNAASLLTRHAQD